VATHQSSGVLVYIRITRCIACCVAGPHARLLRDLYQDAMDAPTPQKEVLEAGRDGIMPCPGDEVR
jgi:hypothetical protein